MTKQPIYELSDDKATLRQQLQQLTDEYLARGGTITVCPPSRRSSV